MKEPEQEGPTVKELGGWRYPYHSDRGTSPLAFSKFPHDNEIHGILSVTSQHDQEIEYKYSEPKVSTGLMNCSALHVSIPHPVKAGRGEGGGDHH